MKGGKCCGRACGLGPRRSRRRRGHSVSNVAREWGTVATAMDVYKEDIMNIKLFFCESYFGRLQESSLP